MPVTFTTIISSTAVLGSNNSALPTWPVIHALTCCACLCALQVLHTEHRASTRQPWQFAKFISCQRQSLQPYLSKNRLTAWPWPLYQPTMSRLRSYLASNTLLRNLATMYPSSCHHCIKRLMATRCYCRNCALADKLRRLPSNQWPIQYQSFNTNQWEIGGTSKLMPRCNSNLNQRVNDTSCQCANAWRKLILQLPNGLWQKN